MVMLMLSYRLALALLLSIAPCAHCQQQKFNGPRYAIMDDYVRERLGREWDAHLTDRPMLERGFCLAWQLDEWAGEPAFRVTQIARPDSVEATVSTIHFVCPKGTNVVELHVHPPQSCVDDQLCWAGGTYAYQCLPSELDINYLNAHPQQAFAMVQCDRHAIIAYFPRRVVQSP